MTYLNKIVEAQTIQIFETVWLMSRQYKAKCKPNCNKQVVVPYARKVRNKVQGRAQRVFKRFAILKAKSEMRRAYNAAV